MGFLARREMPPVPLLPSSAGMLPDWIAAVAGDRDFGIEALQTFVDAATASGTIATLLAPRANAPVLLPAYADLWATTSPAPAATPGPSLFLHGPSVSPDVQIIWRTDADPENIETANLSLEICPPSALEALAVPIWAVQRWLRLQPYANISDVPERDPEAEREEPSPGLPVLRYDDGTWRSTFPNEIRPGDTIVVPTSYGGCDTFGWNPDSTREVVDRGTEAHYRQRLKGALRFTPATLANAINAERSPAYEINSSTAWRGVAASIADADDDIDGEAVVAALAALDDLPMIWRRLLAAMKNGQPVIEFYNDQIRSAGFILYTRKPVPRSLLDAIEEDSNVGSEAVSDSDKSSNIGVQVRLADHLAHVEATARGFTRATGLDERLTELVALAARLHDLGKADPRFQADLYGKSALARMGFTDISYGSLLAKSDRTGGIRSTPSAAPELFRHEALSVAFAATDVSRCDATPRKQASMWHSRNHLAQRLPRKLLLRPMTGRSAGRHQR
jgi:CRISPR-associated endonuclease/helicase Cas3